MNSGQDRLLNAVLRQRRDSRNSNQTTASIVETQAQPSQKTPEQEKHERFSRALERLFGRVASNGNKYVVGNIIPRYENISDVDEISNLIQSITHNIATIKRFEPTARPDRYRIII